MSKTVFLIWLLLCTHLLYAQDTLWVNREGKNKFIVHRVEDGETLFILAQRFNVPLAKLSDINQVNYQDGLHDGSLFKIPIDKYNYYRINSVVKSRPVYYKTTDGETLRQISRLFNVPQSVIQTWNKLDNPDIHVGQVLQVGWVYYDPSAVPFAAKADKKGTSKTLMLIKKEQKKHFSKDSISLSLTDTAERETSFERIFNAQNEADPLITESGAAVFYPLRMQVKQGHYFAFHDDLPRGTIISVENPATGAIIYAKVIGPLPKINEYHNAIIGLSNNAASVLSAKGKRMFCKITYR